MQGSKQLTYSVLKSFRFAGRDYEPGVAFNARRVDPNRTQLNRWLDEGFIALPGQKPEPVEKLGDFQFPTAVQDEEETDESVSPF